MSTSGFTSPRTRGRRRSFSRAEIRLMRDLYEQGWGSERIADRLNCGPTTVRNYVGDKIRPTAERSTTPEQETRLAELMRTPGMTKAEAARQVGVSYSIVKRLCQREKIVRKPKHKLASEADGVPVQPLRVFLQRGVQRRIAYNNGHARSLKTGPTRAKGVMPLPPRDVVCGHCGITQRLLFAWEHERQDAETAFDIADRILIGLERGWWEVFDPTEHEPGLLHWRQRDDVLVWLDVVDRMSRLWDGERLLGPDDPNVERERAAAIRWAQDEGIAA